MFNVGIVFNYIMDSTLLGDILNNTCQTSTQYPKPSKSVTSTEIVIQSFVLVTGVVGIISNGVVMVSMRRRKVGSPPMNALVMNQLAMDVFSSVSIVIVYTWKLSNVHLYDTWNVVMCILIGSEDFISIGTNGSFFNLTTITAQRYWKIVFMTSYTKYYHKWITYLFIVLAWVYGFLLNFPAIYTTTDFSDGRCIPFTIWPNAASGEAFGWICITALYFLPLVIFVYCYSHILVTIRRSGQFFKDSETVNQTRSTKQQRNEYGLIKTMIVITVVFFVFWAPVNVVFILAESKCCGVNTSGDAWQVGMIFGTVTLVLDPFIYAVRSNAVKEYFKKKLDSGVSEIHSTNISSIAGTTLRSNSGI